MKIILAATAALGIAISGNVLMAACDDGEMVIKLSHVTNTDKHPKGIAASLLQQRVNDLIDQQGPDAPAAYWIYTNEDIFTIDDNGDEEYQPLSVCEEVLSDVQDVDYIHTVIVDAIEDSLKEKAQ